MSTRVAVYARYSSGRQKQTSIDDQISMAEDFCQREGWSIVQIYTDMEKTGRNTRREGYQSMMAAAHRHEFDMVVTESIDRLNRKVRDAIDIYELLTFQNIGLHAIQEGRQSFINVLFGSYGAQIFSEKIADHTIRGMQGATRRMRTHARPYGYRIREAEVGPNRELDEDQAVIVRRIFTEFASGKSATAIAASLNMAQIPGPKGGSWDGSTLRGNAKRQEGLLRNRLYIGIASVCKNTHSYHPETGARRIKPTPEVMVEQEIPELRIIDQPLWESVKAELERRSAHTPKTIREARRKSYLLSGILTCGCCGAPYVIVSRTSYGCREARKKACNNTVPISRKRIEARVFKALDQAFRSPELITQFEAAMETERKKMNDGSLDRERARLGAALKKAEQGQANILDAISDGAPYATFKARMEDLNEQISRLKQCIADIETQITNSAQAMESAAAVHERVLDQLAQLLTDPDFVEEANGYLAMLINKVTLIPDETAPNGLSATLELSSDAVLPGAANNASTQRQGVTTVVF